MKDIKKELLLLAESLRGATKACEKIVSELCNSTDISFPAIKKCPMCGEFPEIREVESGLGNCYSITHCDFSIAVIGGDIGGAIEQWNRLVDQDIRGSDNSEK